MNRRAQARGMWLGACAVLLVTGCGRKGPPSGGPPDLTPPRLTSSVPDSGAAGVSRSAMLQIAFSEGMEPRSTGEAVSLAPRVEIRQRRWSGRTLSLVLAESLQANQTYILFVGTTARDRHGNSFETGATVPFSTAATFPPGRISGTVVARGFRAAGTYLWCYEQGREPDSTARDFDALGLADEQGHFEVPGLAVPGRYRLWAFADLNQNRSFEPGTDVLTPADSTFDLTPGHPTADGVTIEVVNPRAPATVAGAVLDTLADSLGVTRVLAVSERDTLKRVQVDADERGGFEFTLDPGEWRIMAYRDLDKNRAWKMADEPASIGVRVTVAPAEDVKQLVLVLERARGVPSSP